MAVGWGADGCVVDEHLEDSVSDTPIQDRTSRANYLVVPVSLCSSMPAEWQEKFAALMDEFSEEFPEPAVASY